jgi:uncharacterized circularly permuted ATP-grasp superfamily protein
MNPAQTNQFAHSAPKNYLLDDAYDEMFAGEGELHPHYEPLLEHFNGLSSAELRRRKQSADLSFLNQGITFTVYGRDADHYERRVGDGRARAYTADNGAESVSQRHL